MAPALGAGIISVQIRVLRLEINKISKLWEHGVGWSARMSEEHEVTVRFRVFPLDLYGHGDSLPPL